MPNFTKQTETLEIEQSEKSLIETANTLGEVYFIRKDAEDEQKELRDEFFRKTTLEIKSENLAQKTVKIPESIAADKAEIFVLQYNPGWIIITNQDDNFIIEEDPDYKQFSIVTETNPAYVVTKTIRLGTTMLDLERLKLDDSQLYWRVTKYNSRYEILFEYDPKSKDRIVKFLQDREDLRVIKNPDDLSSEDLEALGPYTFEGPKTKALNVRKAKPEEIGQG